MVELTCPIQTYDTCLTQGVKICAMPCMSQFSRYIFFLPKSVFLDHPCCLGGVIRDILGVSINGFAICAIYRGIASSSAIHIGKVLKPN